MKVKDEIVTLLETRHLTGVGKSSGKPYDFYTIVVGDDDFNKFEATVGREDLVDGVLPSWLVEIMEQRGQIVVDLVLTPEERNIKLRIENLRPIK